MLSEPRYFKLLSVMTILIVAGTLFSELSDTNKVIRTQGGIRLSKSNNSAAYNNQFVEILPTTSAELLKRQRSAQFIDKTRLRSENSLIAIDQIFYRLASLKILDPALGDLNDATRQFWVNRVLVFQNPNGGFGEWEYDSSSISATYKALQILDWLGDTSINKSLVKGFLDMIRNTLTGGFNSHIQDADSDVISTYYGIASYKLLGLTIPNELDIKILLQKAQNLNPDTAIVPSNEFGGFGLQTNNQTVFWTSGVEATRAAVMGLDLIGSSPSNVSAAIDFTQGLQAVTIGGFIDTPNPPNSVTGAYTSSALDVVYALGGTPSFPQKAIDYLLSLELPDGSFSRKDTSSSSTLKATYFALNGLTLLGSQPANSAGTLNYILNWMPTGDGFGGTPGELPTLRETFDAVAAITLANISLENGQQIIEYVGSYRNPDGGFGIAGSYTESTLRAAEIYNLLETPFPNPGETILFLQGLQQGDGGFSKKAGSTVSYVVSTYRAVRALEILGAKPMDTPKTIQYLISNQNPDGGFGGFIGDSSDVSSTYRAVRALNILNSAPSDGNAAIEFLKDSQNPDGGFKRSSYDIQRPANISNIIYSYSAVRGLLILNSNPINSTSLYHFISSTRNRDGGYGEHPDFTSNIAYTYVAFWLLKHMPEISNFKVLLPENLNSTRSSYLEFSVEINGGITPLNYTIYLGTSNTIISSGILTSSGTVIVNTSSLQPGTHTLRLVVFDLSGMTIEANLILLIGTPKQSPIDFLFVFLALMMLGSSVTIYRKWKLR